MLMHIGAPGSMYQYRTQELNGKGIEYDLAQQVAGINQAFGA